MSKSRSLVLHRGRGRPCHAHVENFKCGNCPSIDPQLLHCLLLKYYSSHLDSTLLSTKSVNFDALWGRVRVWRPARLSGKSQWSCQLGGYRAKVNVTRRSESNEPEFRIRKTFDGTEARSNHREVIIRCPRLHVWGKGGDCDTRWPIRIGVNYRAPTFGHPGRAGRGRDVIEDGASPRQMHGDRSV